MSLDRALPCARRACAAVLVPLLASCAAPPPPVAPGPPAAGYRIYDTRAREFISLPELAERLAGARVVLFGERHDDVVAHRVQHELLETLAADGVPVVLGLEMFERDVQPQLDAYLAGRISEEELLRSARPWPNYTAAYRPLVEAARARGWPVVASNAPRPLAAKVAQGGRGALDALPPGERDRVARELRCPEDEYFARFAEAMGGGAGHPGAVDEEVIGRLYLAQCLKDETMAESIVRAVEAHPGAVVVHVQGGFHSDYGQGIGPRVRRRSPGAGVRTLSAVPVEEPDAVDPGEHRARADYLVFTRAPSPAGASPPAARPRGL